MVLVRFSRAQSARTFIDRVLVQGDGEVFRVLLVDNRPVPLSQSGF
jgi:hypothetical protein